MSFGGELVIKYNYIVANNLIGRIILKMGLI